VLQKSNLFSRKGRDHAGPNPPRELTKDENPVNVDQLDKGGIHKNT